MFDNLRFALDIQNQISLLLKYICMNACSILCTREYVLLISMFVDVVLVYVLMCVCSLIDFFILHRDYVTKCFTLCQNDTERDSVEKFLKDELNRIVGKGEQWLLDFSTMPLPPM